MANWDYISQVACSQSPELKQIPLIGNGDIFSFKDYEDKILKRVNSEVEDVNGIKNNNNLLPTAMLGRGALIKPWLPTEIKERRHWDISASERLEMLKDFVRFGLEHWGSDQQGVNQTRRFLLEWLSFLHRLVSGLINEIASYSSILILSRPLLFRYVPVGMLEVIPQQMNHRPPIHLVSSIRS